MPRVKTFDEKAVLEKAMTLFWEKGYAATSIQDLVNFLGINRASLYDTYGGKYTLFREAFELYRQKYIEGIKEFLKNQPDVKKGILLLFETAIVESVKDKNRKGCFVVNTTTEMIPYDNEMLSVLEKNKHTIEGMFYDYLRKGEGENQFKQGKDLKSIASLLFTLYNGLKVIAKIEPRKKSLTTTVTTALSLLD